MLNAINEATTDQTDQARHAYNIAFEKLGLNWHWDAATYSRLHSGGQFPVRTYLETEQAHLLCAYEADFLLKAIEAAKAGEPTLKRHTPASSETPLSLLS